MRFLECRLTGAAFRGAQLDDVLIERGVADLVSLRLSVSSSLWVVATSMTEADFYDAVCAGARCPPPAPGTGSPIDDLRAMARHLADELQSARWSAVLP